MFSLFRTSPLVLCHRLPSLIHGRPRPRTTESSGRFSYSSTKKAVSRAGVIFIQFSSWKWISARRSLLASSPSSMYASYTSSRISSNVFCSGNVGRNGKIKSLSFGLKPSTNRRACCRFSYFMFPLFYSLSYTICATSSMSFSGSASGSSHGKVSLIIFVRRLHPHTPSSACVPVNRNVLLGEQAGVSASWDIQGDDSGAVNLDYGGDDSVYQTLISVGPVSSEVALPP